MGYDSTLTQCGDGGYKTIWMEECYVLDPIDDFWGGSLF
jgi:hypothetical protein